MHDARFHGFHERGYLPHLKREGAEYFVTFRLADSLPRVALERLEAELDTLYPPHHAVAATALADPATGERQLERQRRIEHLLDQGSGSCCLEQPAIAQLVVDALLHFQGTRYDLGAWVVMPNHVHVLARPRAQHSLGSILKSWKQYTSTHAKLHAAVPAGRFWQPEAYDHWVRDQAERTRITRYIHQNPVTAGLCAQPEDWPWSSAAGGSADFQSASAPIPDAG